MSATAARALTIADVTAALRYAQAVMPLVLPPDLPDPDDVGIGPLNVEFNVHLHRVPPDVFDAMLAINDDLPWDEVKHHHPATSSYYRTVALQLHWCRLTVYTSADRRGGR